MTLETLYSIGTALTLAGMLIMIVATVLLLLSKKGKTGKTRGGGVILIGPIPIIFGTDKQSLKTILLLSIVLTTLLIALVIILYFLNK
ncbi:MAG: DUF131 domain-containing protein [Candidatus Bathyarchaeia archaeon]|jgi:uncharacterized protein (TIGR00304 family)